MYNSLRSLSQLGSNLKTCKVCLVGANGNVGRLLALNLKLNKYVTHLALYDRSDLEGMREDLSHIDTKVNVTAHSGDEKALIESLRCSDIMVIAAAQSGSYKLATSAAMFDANAGLIMKFMKATAETCRCNMPFIHIITSPVNSLVPLCAEYLKELDCYNPRKLIGSTSVDSMRARTFLGQLVNQDPSKLTVPVLGGHSSRSITPLVSQAKPKFELSSKDQQQLALRTIQGGDEVMNAKDSGGLPYLAMGHCASKFCDAICRVIQGEKDSVVEVGFVPSDVNELEFFACNFSLNSEGIKECHRLPLMSPFEVELYSRAVEDVKKSIGQAKEFFQKYKIEE